MRRFVLHCAELGLNCSQLFGILFHYFPKPNKGGALRLVSFSKAKGIPLKDTPTAASPSYSGEVPGPHVGFSFSLKGTLAFAWVCFKGGN